MTVIRNFLLAVLSILLADKTTLPSAAVVIIAPSTILGHGNYDANTQKCSSSGLDNSTAASSRCSSTHFPPGHCFSCDPVPIDFPKKLTSVCSARSHTLFVSQDDGHLYGVGVAALIGYSSNENICRRGGDAPFRITLPSGERAISVACGVSHSLVLTAAPNNNVYSFGYNTNGALGLGVSPFLDPFRLSPSLINTGDLSKERRATLGAPQAIAAGDRTSYVITSNGYVVAFGDGTYLGLGATKAQMDVSTPTALSGFGDKGTRASAVSTKLKHTLVLEKTQGLVYAWGSNTKNQVSSANDDIVYVPTLVPDVRRVDFIAAGVSHSLVAVKSSVNLYGFGDNAKGQLGLSPHMHSRVRAPRLLPLVSVFNGLMNVSITDLSAGLDTTYIALEHPVVVPSDPLQRLSNLVVAGDNQMCALGLGDKVLRDVLVANEAVRMYKPTVVNQSTFVFLPTLLTNVHLDASAVDTPMVSRVFAGEYRRVYYKLTVWHSKTPTVSLTPSQSVSDPTPTVGTESSTPSRTQSPAPTRTMSFSGTPTSSIAVSRTSVPTQEPWSASPSSSISHFVVIPAAPQINLVNYYKSPSTGARTIEVVFDQDTDKGKAALDSSQAPSAGAVTGTFVVVPASSLGSDYVGWWTSPRAFTILLRDSVTGATTYPTSVSIRSGVEIRNTVGNSSAAATGAANTVVGSPGTAAPTPTPTSSAAPPTASPSAPPTAAPSASPSPATPSASPSPSSSSSTEWWVWLVVAVCAALVVALCVYVTAKLYHRRNGRSDQHVNDNDEMGRNQDDALDRGCEMEPYSSATHNNNDHYTGNERYTTYYSGSNGNNLEYDYGYNQSHRDDIHNTSHVMFDQSAMPVFRSPNPLRSQVPPTTAKPQYPRRRQEPF